MALATHVASEQGLALAPVTPMTYGCDLRSKSLYSTSQYIESVYFKPKQIEFQYCFGSKHPYGLPKYYYTLIYYGTIRTLPIPLAQALLVLVHSGDVLRVIAISAEKSKR